MEVWKMKKYTKPLFEVTSFENDESIMKLSSANFNMSKNNKSEDYNVIEF
jgi:hypothetical protein